MTITADDYIDRVLRWLPRATPQRAQIAMELRGHITELFALFTENRQRAFELLSHTRVARNGN